MTTRSPLCIYPLTGLPEVDAKSDLAALLHASLLRANCWPLQAGDVLCVVQKVVSKAEGQVIDLAKVTPSPFALAWARQWGRDARLIELVLQHSVRIVLQKNGVLIVETQSGLVCANAGIDLSNTGEHPNQEVAILLPKDANASAQRLQRALGALQKPSVALGVLIADSFGRPWRVGLTQVVIGAAGMPVLHDLREQVDANQRSLQTTQIAIADELAGAADLVCGKTKGIPAALIRGYVWPKPSTNKVPTASAHTAQALVRKPAQDLFR